MKKRIKFGIASALVCGLVVWIVLYFSASESISPVQEAGPAVSAERDISGSASVDASDDELTSFAGGVGDDRLIDRPTSPLLAGLDGEDDGDQPRILPEEQLSGLPVQDDFGPRSGSAAAEILKKPARSKNIKSKQ